MFDVSLVELAVIALVALLVLGPERLPRAARTVGLYVRKARQSWYSVRADIERELAADELKRSLERGGKDIRDAIGVDQIRDDLHRVRLAPPPEAAAATPALSATANAPEPTATPISNERLPEQIDSDPAPVAASVVTQTPVTTLVDGSGSPVDASAPRTP